MNAKNKSNDKQILTLENENWKVIESHPNYEISDLGRCRHTYKNGNVKIVAASSRYQGKDKKQRKSDYRFHTLNGVKHYVHFLVLTAFVSARPDGFEADHVDGVRTNNQLTNLRWLSAAENRSHKGEQHPASKLTDQKVIAARFMYQQFRELGATYKAIGQMFNVSGDAVRRAITGKNWSHV